MSQAKQTEMVEHKTTAPVVQADSSAIMEVISRAASDPNTDVDKLERMMAMYERMEEKKAKIAYNSALPTMLANIPEITEGGQIKHGQNVISEYARWDEDIHPVLKPILKEHGFSLTFRINTSEGIKVTAVLAHENGHSESTEICLPVDTSGSKNAVQAVASSVSYGKRYTAGALLNIATAGQDDDGNSAITPKITDEQAANIRALIDEVGADEFKFCRYLQVRKIDDINALNYDAAIRALEKKREA